MPTKKELIKVVEGKREVHDFVKNNSSSMMNNPLRVSQLSSGILMRGASGELIGEAPPREDQSLLTLD